MEVPIPQHQRLSRLFSPVVVLLATALAVAGCNNTPVPQQEEGTASVQFSIASGDVLPASTGGASLERILSASAIAYSDVTNIRINIWETGKQSQPLYVNFDLEKQPDSTWKGTIPFLPKNKSLTFSATAYKATTELFKGSTNQTLTGDVQSVTIALSPATHDAQIKLPRIRKVLVPAEVTSNQSGNVSFVVEATTGEELTYTITKATGVPGSFLPESGSIALQTTSGTFVSQYLAPNVTAETDYEYTVTVTNTTGHSVSSTFKLKVKPPGGTNGAKDTELLVVFNPIINGLNGQRVLGTGNVIWTADVTSANAATVPLTYAWSFSPSATYTPAPDLTSTSTNPTTLQNYTTAVQGTLNLAVTDSRGGTTTLRYPITTGQFPDNPIEVSVPTGINSIRGGYNHTCVLFNSGDVRCWGFNDKGQLGYGDTFTTGAGGTTFPYPYSRPVVDMVGKGVKLALGGNHTCALFDSGFVRCWGLNDKGQLGYKLGVPTAANPNAYNVGDGEPVYTYGNVNLGGNAVKIAAGFEHTCALMDTGKVRCWGSGGSGQLGYGNTNNIGDDEYPYVSAAGDVSVGGTVQDIVAGGYHTCALLDTGDVRCWGSNSNGQLGLGSNATTLSNDKIGDNELPSSRSVVSLGGSVVQLSAGMYHTCALMSTGNVRCWGSNGHGQLGLGHYNDIGDNEALLSSATVDVGGKVLQVSADDGHTCALLSTGDIKCWGLNGNGQLGLGNTANAATTNTPGTTTVNLDGNSAYQITTGGKTSCALLANGKARCWGRNQYGMLGLGHTTDVGRTTQTTYDVLLTAP
jgi:alpha-tubulin suppressor-like RCC1 family protein